MKGMTINDLAHFCEVAIAKGNGNKRILISQDDEGNGFHELFFEFGNAEELCSAYCGYPYGIDLKEYVTLG